MPATGPKNITEASLKAALRKNAGVFVLAAQELGCDRTNVAQRIRRSPKLQEFVASLEAEASDMADAVIIDTLSRRGMDKRPTKEAQNMAKWKKDHELRKKGMLLRMEHSGPDGAPLPPSKMVIQVEYVDSLEPDEDAPI